MANLSICHKFGAKISKKKKKCKYFNKKMKFCFIFLHFDANFAAGFYFFWRKFA